VLALDRELRFFGFKIPDYQSCCRPDVRATCAHGDIPSFDRGSCNASERTKIVASERDRIGARGAAKSIQQSRSGSGYDPLVAHVGGKVYWDELPPRRRALKWRAQKPQSHATTRKKAPAQSVFGTISSSRNAVERQSNQAREAPGLEIVVRLCRRMTKSLSFSFRMLVPSGALQG